MQIDKLKVPDWKKFGPKEVTDTHRSYFDMLSGLHDDASAATSRINQANQGQLDAGTKSVFGAGTQGLAGGAAAEAAQEGLNTLRARMRGEFTTGERSLLDQQYTSRAQAQGLAGSLAGIKYGVSGMGKSMLAASQQAMAALPGFMSGMAQTLRATPTRVESMFVPIQQYASQQAAEKINAWRAELAQAQAEHSAAMANQAYNLQKQQVEDARQRASRGKSFTVAHPSTSQGYRSWNSNLAGRSGRQRYSGSGMGRNLS